MRLRALSLLMFGCVGDESQPTVAAPTETDGPPGGNVLIVVIDDVGVDRIGFYGAERPAVTPTLDSLAETGLVFDNAWSLALCGPTRATLQTGLLPRRTGYGQNSSPTGLDDIELDPAFTTLPELVATSPLFSYDSSYVGKWHLSTVNSPSGTLGPKVQGWRWWTGLLTSPDHWFGPNPTGAEPSYFHFEQVNDAGDLVPTDGYATTTTTDEAIARLQVMPEPWLLQVAYNAAHDPFHEPPADLINTPLGDDPPIPDLHRAMLEAMDHELARLLAAFPPDVRERTTVLVLGDNGTPRPAVDTDEDPDRLKGSLYDGGVHVPFLVTGPLVRTPGQRTDALVSVVDIFPTVAEIAGAVPDRELDGTSLLPVLADPSTDVRAVVYAEKFRPGGGGPFLIDQRAVRDDRYKLTLDVLCGRESFYEYVPGAWDEGPDLLEAGTLTAEQQEARVALQAQLATIAGSLSYEATTWPSSEEIKVVCPEPAPIR